ncbi:MAG: hypothetical protein WC648_00060 [Candidatus Paceibacterota bacterium]|jgi:hypothetical protein
MTTIVFLLFLGAFVAPIIYERWHFMTNLQAFFTTPLRTRTGLQIHHGHWGLLFIIISGLWMVFLGRNTPVIIFFGYGLGLLVDEIIPSLKMPSKGRELELQIYKSSLRHTLLLAVAFLICFAILFAMSG